MLYVSDKVLNSSFGHILQTAIASLMQLPSSTLLSEKYLPTSSIRYKCYIFQKYSQPDLTFLTAGSSIRGKSSAVTQYANRSVNGIRSCFKAHSSSSSLVRKHSSETQWGNHVNWSFNTFLPQQSAEHLRQMKMLMLGDSEPALYASCSGLLQTKLDVGSTCHRGWEKHRTFSLLHPMSLWS